MRCPVEAIRLASGSSNILLGNGDFDRCRPQLKRSVREVAELAVSASSLCRCSQGEQAELFGAECHLYCGKVLLGDLSKRLAGAAAPGRWRFVGCTEKNEETVIVAGDHRFLVLTDVAIIIVENC